MQEKAKGEQPKDFFIHSTAIRAGKSIGEAQICAIHMQRWFCIVKAVLQMPKHTISRSSPVLIKLNGKAENWKQRNQIK